MLDNVRFSGTVDSISTNWSKHKVNIKVSGTYAELSEVESQSVGKFHSIETPVRVSVSISTQEKVEFDAKIGGVKTDWVTGETKITMVVDITAIDFGTKSSILGMWAEKEQLLAFSFEPAQKGLL